MISSMTGFGRGEVERDGYRAVFEVSSLNSRFLEVSFRTPRWMAGFEPGLRALTTSKLQRGKVVSQLTWEKTLSESSVEVNEVLFEAYVETAKRLAAKHQLRDALSVDRLLTLPDLWVSKQANVEGDLIEGIVREALALALTKLVSMRDAEGEKLAAAFVGQVNRIQELAAQVREMAKGQVDQYREKLTQRVEDLFGSGNYDMQRLAQEVAYVAERCDITEECDRLEIHCTHFLDTLKASDPVGRRLNFLLQEMNREINTLGSKSADIGISGVVVDLKDELEKIREQVQNVE